MHPLQLKVKYMGVSKNRGKTPKMDGENNGNPIINHPFWGYHYFWKQPYNSLFNCMKGFFGTPLFVFTFFIVDCGIRKHLQGAC